MRRFEGPEKDVPQAVSNSLQERAGAGRVNDSIECETGLRRWALYLQVQSLQTAICELLIANQQLRMEIAEARRREVNGVTGK